MALCCQNSNSLIFFTLKHSLIRCEFVNTHILAQIFFQLGCTGFKFLAGKLDSVMAAPFLCMQMMYMTLYNLHINCSVRMSVI